MYHNADSGRVYIRLGELEGREFMAEGKINAEGLEQAILTVRAGAGPTNYLTCLCRWEVCIQQPICSKVRILMQKYVQSSLSVQTFAP